MDSTVMIFRQMGGVNLDIDATFLIQLTMIVVTMLVLRKLVFQPYLRVATVRDELTTKTVERAVNTSDRAETLAQEFEAKLAAAKQEALAARTAIRAQGAADKDKAVDKANADAQAMLAQEREKLAKDVEIVRSASQSMVNELSDAIVSKILKRGSDSFTVAAETEASVEGEVQA